MQAKAAKVGFVTGAQGIGELGSQRQPGSVAGIGRVGDRIGIEFLHLGIGIGTACAQGQPTDWCHHKIGLEAFSLDRARIGQVGDDGAVQIDEVIGLEPIIFNRERSKVELHAIVEELRFDPRFECVGCLGIDRHRIIGRGVIEEHVEGRALIPAGIAGIQHDVVCCVNLQNGFTRQIAVGAGTGRQVGTIAAAGDRAACRVTRYARPGCRQAGRSVDARSAEVTEIKIVPRVTQSTSQRDRVIETIGALTEHGKVLRRHIAVGCCGWENRIDRIRKVAWLSARHRINRQG